MIGGIGAATTCVTGITATTDFNWYYQTTPNLNVSYHEPKSPLEELRDEISEWLEL